MRLLLCGVRGSTPAPGPEFVRVGGHTSCVAVAADGRDPALVIDGGTGLRRLDRFLQSRPFRGTIMLGHLHWDHVQGLPFFASAQQPHSSTRVLIPRQGDAEEVLARAFSPPHFPVRPRELRGGWRFGELEAGEHEIEGFRVLALDIPHPGGRTFGFRVSTGQASFAYLSDHSPVALGAGPDGLGDCHDSALKLATGVDLLIHDAQHTAAEYPDKAFLGHATVEYAVRLATAAHARRLLLFHHDPDRSDQQVEALVEGARRGSVPVGAAVEGTELALPAPEAPT